MKFEATVKFLRHSEAQVVALYSSGKLSDAIVLMDKLKDVAEDGTYEPNSVWKFSYEDGAFNAKRIDGGV